MTLAAPAASKGRKYNAVLNGARDVFMRDGFEGASVDDIARAANVSKATLYSYFSDKRALFREVTRTECERMAEAILSQIDYAAPPRDVMTTAADKLVRFLLSDFSLRMFRICVAEAERFPELGRAFYQNGPEMGRTRMVEYITQAITRGELRGDDPGMIAEQFAELCRTRLWTRAIFGVQTEFSEAEITAIVSETVETILARYGA